METLKDFVPFNTLEREPKEALEKITRLKHYKKNEMICYEEDKCEEVYFLLQGEVRLYKVNRFGGEVVLGLLNQGLLVDYKGEAEPMAFANLECKEESLVACFKVSSLFELMRIYPQIMALFLNESLKKLNMFEKLIKQELIFDSTAKIAYFLHCNLFEFNRQKKNENASFLNIQPETLSRILKKLHREGIITTNQDGKIEILDDEKLRAIYE